MQLTVATWDDRVVMVDLDGNDTVETLKTVLEVETGVPAAQQQLIFNGRPLQNGTLGSAGLNNGDLIMLSPAQQAAAPQQPRQRQQRQQQQAPQNPALALGADGSAVAPAAFIQAVKMEPGMLQALEQNNPKLAKLIREDDIAGLQAELKRIHAANQERDAALKRQQELLEADPFDPEIQKRIEELIQQQNIEENLAQAMEYNPEVFAQVEMLYVNMEVNGVPVKTFVDSGAQMTIMTEDFANKCYLSRLIDKRFAGMAVGVGSSRIIGRIHQTPLNVAGHYLTCSITVLEQKDGPQFIFGLDMLRRHQCCIDLARSELRFGSCNAALHFLPDHEIPKDFKRHIRAVSQKEAEQSMASAKKDAADPSGAGTSAAAAAAPPAAPAPAAQPAAAPAAPAAAGGEREAKLQRLMHLGFDRASCVAALDASSGSEEMAASILFGDMMM